MVGGRICERLVSLGYRVRVLSRQKQPFGKDIEFFNGDIVNEEDVKVFMQESRLFFHCAAELKDESRMWAVNVRGTENILKYAEKFGINYFCHLSSVGVIGKTDLKLVDELTPCNPQNAYEKSKWAAEQIVTRGIKGCKVIILRPTNVIDEKRPGILTLPQRRSFVDFFKVFIKGGECTHIVHAKDVAAAAVHFISYPLEEPQCYIVSCDQKPLNTLAEVWAFYNAFRNGKKNNELHPVPHLPLFVPYLLRKVVRKRGNMGDVCYSSKKLMETGFIFKFGVKEAILSVIRQQNI